MPTKFLVDEKFRLTREVERTLSERSLQGSAMHELWTLLEQSNSPVKCRFPSLFVSVGDGDVVPQFKSTKRTMPFDDGCLDWQGCDGN